MGRLACFAVLPVEFRADLTNAWIARIGHDSETRIADVPVRIHKLRVVEDVEKFNTEIESLVFLNLGALQQPEIGVIEAWAVEEAPVGGAESAWYAVQRERGHTN